MKRALLLLFLALPAFGQTGKQPKPPANSGDSESKSQQDTTDFVRDLRGRERSCRPVVHSAWHLAAFLGGTPLESDGPYLGVIKSQGGTIVRISRTDGRPDAIMAPSVAQLVPRHGRSTSWSCQSARLLPTSISVRFSQVLELPGSMR
jgi:hypothetical protein